MPISTEDETTSEAANRPRRAGVDVLKYRESHGGRAPWEKESTAIGDTGSARTGKLTGVELLKYRESHGGLTPDQVAAKDADRAARSAR
jgi:hypothetical protein